MLSFREWIDHKKNDAGIRSHKKFLGLSKFKMEFILFIF